MQKKILTASVCRIVNLYLQGKILRFYLLMLFLLSNLNIFDQSPCECSTSQGVHYIILTKESALYINAGGLCYCKIYHSTFPALLQHTDLVSHDLFFSSSCFNKINY